MDGKTSSDGELTVLISFAASDSYDTLYNGIVNVMVVSLSR